jgi:hypothetical protein
LIVLAVKEAYKPFLEGTFDASIKPHGYAAEADNGEYLIRRSTYTVGKNPKEFAFEQIYKKHNGKYLIYHDEFEYST